ncbi:MAG: RnfH family protein [Gammaproteobacteria bacterium]|nr:RnfH family protein [Gammaproteobacteria bacterium]MCK5092293.1 RnfH family protein [Gammaproteobacteria bacterium]
MVSNSVSSKGSVRIEVAYALPDDQMIIPLTVDEGTTVEQAIIHSGIIDHYPQIDLPECKAGIFGKLTKMDKPVRDGDRIEIYRPLIADPKEVRRKRAAEGKKMKKGTA